jgi:hypothetical protein
MDRMTRQRRRRRPADNGIPQRRDEGEHAMPDRTLLIGLDEPEARELVARLPGAVVDRPTLPRLRLDAGRLSVERLGWVGEFLEVERVVYHGIFDDDFPALSALALWGGPCLPDAAGMMDARLPIPCLARARRVSRFGGLPRSWADRGTVITPPGPSVAKWGDWHCGEGKDLVTGPHACEVPTLVEPFVAGRVVRVHLMGDRVWQIALAGDDWKKSIHHPAAALTPVDRELSADTRGLAAAFRLEMLAVDYVVADDGGRHLLEVNHIPNVTRFPEIRAAYLDLVERWVRTGRA